MITQKDKIGQFKRDCKSNEFYTKMILDCNERLEEIAIKLNGISSPCPQKAVYENANDPYKENKLYWLLKEECIIKERDEYIRRINDVNHKLMMILDPVDRQMIVDLYVEKKNHEYVADKYHMNRQNMYKHINKIIAKIV